MEPFGAAALGAVVSVTMAKLLAVKDKKAKPNATIIRDRLEMITAKLEDYTSGSETLSGVQAQWIARLRRLAYDIEDRIDCFHADKTTPSKFRTEIADLMTSSEAMNKDIAALAHEQNVMGRTQGSRIEPRDPCNNERELYLCLFPGNRPVRTKPLVRRWLAEGLVQGEQLVVEKLDDFINLSIFDSIKRSNNGMVRECQSSKETLQRISQQSFSVNFILVSGGSTQVPERYQVARRLSVHPPASGGLILPQDLSRLRTLAVFPDAGATSVSSYEAVLDFSRYEVLRVLDLKYCAHLTKKHLDDIILHHRQVLLKYLSINLDSIGWIEREIGHLKQLETLDLGGTETVEVFKEVLLLPKLKHLLGKFQLSTIDAPSNIDKTFSVGRSELVKFLSNDSVLETLDGFVSGDGKGLPQLMGLMKSLRKVKIWFEPDASGKNLLVHSCAIKKFICDGTDQSDLKRSLSIDFEGASGEFANEIEAVAGYLDSLKLRGKLNQFPPFVSKLRGIVELCLWSTDMSWEVIQAGLSDVAGLKFLKLIEDNLQCFDILSETAKQLRSVERICAVCKKELKVAITAAPLPSLVSVQIICQELHDSPGTDGINITGMGKLEEVALHLHVDVGIRTRLQEAAVGHVNARKPKVLLLDYPQ